jgi:hypothetical protein
LAAVRAVRRGTSTVPPYVIGIGKGVLRKYDIAVVEWNRLNFVTVDSMEPFGAGPPSTSTT